MYSRMLHFFAVYSSVGQCVVVCGSVLQCVAVCCSVLQCAAVCCSVLHQVTHIIGLSVSVQDNAPAHRRLVQIKTPLNACVYA